MYSTNLDHFNLIDVEVEYSGRVTSSINFDIESSEVLYPLDFSPESFTSFFGELCKFNKDEVDTCTLKHWSGTISLERIDKDSIRFEITIDDESHPIQPQQAKKFGLLKLEYARVLNAEYVQSIQEEFKYLSEWVEEESASIAN